MWRRIKGALGMGLVWAFGWGAVGGVMELLANFIPRLNVVDMWIQPFVIGGFVAGAFFSLVLGIAARNKRFEELSVLRFTVWGTIGGLLAGVAPTALFGPSLVIVPLMVLSAASAAATLAIARGGKQPALAEGERPQQLR
jgi:hypothetical protein